MKCLFLTFNHPENKTGLFYSTHERVKNSIPLLDHYTLLNIQFYDSWFLSLLKSFLGLKAKKKGTEFYMVEDLKYNNIWLKRGVFSAATPWYRFEKWRKSKFLCNETFTSKKKLSIILKKLNQFDFIMAHWGYPNGLIAMKISQQLKKPYFVTYHGSDINVIPQKNPILKKSIEKVLQHAKLNFFVSKALLGEAKKITIDFEGTISYNGIPKYFLENIKKPKNNIKINILFIGNLNYVKRADKLPEIINNTIKKTNKKIKFTIIGEGEYESLIRNELNTSTASFVMTGYLERKEILNYLQNADILILPSRREGLPLVILEAIACGVIPIASNVGGITEILDIDFLVDETSTFIDDFSNKIIQVIDKKIFPSLKIYNYIWPVIMKKDINKIKNLLDVSNEY